MSAATSRFVIFLLISVGGLVLGHWLRRRGWLDEEVSRPLHQCALVCLWSPMFAISFWQLDIDLQLALLMGLQPLAMLWAWAVTAWLARRTNASRDQTGVMVLSGALSNHGLTLGAFICYSLLDPAMTAMGYAVANATSMQIFIVLIFYPVARYYGPEPNMPVARLVTGSFLDIRAMPIYAAGVGTLLSLTGWEIPRWLQGGWLINTIIYVGTLAMYGGIGLRLRLIESRRYVAHQFAISLVKFVAVPGLMIPLVVALHHIGLLELLPAKTISLLSFMPAAMNLVVVSNLFHLDARMASVVWFWNTALFALVPLPLMLWYFR